MPITSVPTMTDTPPFPALADRAAGTYNSKAYAFGAHMGDVFNDEFVAVAASAFANATDASTSATIAQAAAIASGAIAWVSGTTYAAGDPRYSLIDWQTYRRKTAGAGTTDPSADTTNWARVAYRSTPTAMTVRTTSGTTVAPAGVTGVEITVVGGGGGGASGSLYQFCGCGGTAVIKMQAATAGDSFVCVIGGGGSPSAAGGNTTITGAATITAAGGGAGTPTYCATAGASSGGDIVITGDRGTSGNGSTTYGAGGRSMLGAGDSTGSNGPGYGGGGQSGGGAGHAGVVLFKWIY